MHGMMEIFVHAELIAELRRRVADDGDSPQTSQAFWIQMTGKEDIERVCLHWNPAVPFSAIVTIDSFGHLSQLIHSTRVQ